MRKKNSHLYCLFAICFSFGCLSTDHSSRKSEPDLEFQMIRSTSSEDIIENQNNMDELFAFDGNLDFQEPIIDQGFQFYQTQKNDTLMLIAFNIYGDYRKWRELQTLNSHVLNGGVDLSHYPVLKYKKPSQVFELPNENPYLIKKGDSLSLISKKVYGDWRDWPIIHQNNLEQIPSPDLIFAGFTLFYPSLSRRPAEHLD